MTIREAVQLGVETLRASSLSFERDAQILLENAITRSTHFCIAHPEYVLTDSEEKQYRDTVTQRTTGKPIAYITHSKEFYGYNFYVDERVLIPREETEGLVERAIQYARTLNRSARILDLCTGSGCVAITLKKELPDAEIVATDISADAIAVAQKNAEQHSVDISFFTGNLFGALPPEATPFDIIVSNPPYVPLMQYEEDIPETCGLRFEPRIALITHNDQESGLAVIEQILRDAQTHLRSHSLLALEIADVHGERALQLARAFLPNNTTSIEQDLSGRDRYLLSLS